MDQETYQGTIAKVTDKGFGFIAYKTEEGDKEIFFHASGLVEGLMFNDLREGEAVSFQITETDDNRLNAVEVDRAA